MTAHILGQSESASPWRNFTLDQVKVPLQRADVKVQGERPWDIEVSEERFYHRVSAQGSLGLGEAYVDAWWDFAALDRSMLDRRIIYRCAYLRDAETLDAAQARKLDLVYRKLGLKPRMRVLDRGCGRGGAAQFAAERYGVAVMGVTVSQEQASAARKRCGGLPATILLQDYRQLQGRFDRSFWWQLVSSHPGSAAPYPIAR